MLWLGGIASEVYSEALLEVADPADLGATADGVRAALEARGIDHITWERNGSPREYWDAYATSFDFLEGQTVPVAAQDRTYLFRLLAEAEASGGAGWGLGPELLPSTSTNAESGWELRGDGRPEGDGLALTAGSQAKVTIPARAGAAYVLVLRGTCGESGAGELVILVQWKDADGRFTGRDRQPVMLGESGTTFALTVAPADTTSAIVHITPRGGDCLLTELSMREVTVFGGG